MGIMLKILLFICAYSPLLSIIIFQIIPTLDWYYIVLGFSPLILSLMFCCFVYYCNKNTTAAEDQIILSVEDRTHDVVAYIVPYIISIISIGINGVRGLIIVSILIVVLYAIYSNSSLIYFNPLLSLIGYRIYKVEAIMHEEKEGQEAMLISNTSIRKNQKLNTYELADNIYLHSK